MKTSARALRSLLQADGLVDAIGAHDVLAAKLVEQHGFDVVYLGGSSTAAGEFGLPDIGLLTPGELIDHLRRVAAVVQIPIIADLDDGGGNPLRVHRTVQMAEQAGVAGFHIEDMDFSYGKHFLAHDGVGLDFARDTMRPAREFVDSVKAAVDARNDEDVVIIARTDAAGITSASEAIDRACLYAEAGADLVYLCHLATADVPQAVATIPIPLMVHAHELSLAERAHLEQAGVKLVHRPTLTRSVAFRAVSDALGELQRTGELHYSRPTFGETSRAVDGDLWAELAEKYRMAGGRQTEHQVGAAR